MSITKKMIRINEALKKEGVKGVILIFDNSVSAVHYENHAARLMLLNAAETEMKVLNMDNDSKAEDIRNNRDVPINHKEDKDYIG